MAYTLRGTYTGICNCKLVCPCNVDGPPTGKGDQCHGLIVYEVRQGNLDDTDLSGVSFALGYFIPSNPSAGNWELEGVIDEGASQEQAEALDRIISGIGDLNAEFFKDSEGTVTTLSNGMFAFAPIIRLGKSSGRFTVFGESWDASYAEGAEYEYSSA